LYEASDRRPKNRLLRALPDEDYRRLAPALRTMTVAKGFVFFQPNTPVDYVYFPNGGVTSVTTVLADGSTVETATVGSEGMVGLEALLTEDAVAPGEVMVQVGDIEVEQLSAGAFRSELARNGALAHVVGRYAQVLIAQMMQSAACNARHQIQERCARWLLMTHDRVARDEFDLSHEFLATMLGVRRQSVTVVAGELQSAGLITYRHGTIRILDRKRLETASCECYALVREKFDSSFEGQLTL
jgi:CRP-like cAMP-binding protein